MGMDKIKPVTAEQEKDLGKNPPRVGQRIESRNREMLIKSAGLSQNDLNLLGEMGDIQKTLDENGQPKYTFGFKGEKSELGYNYNFEGDKKGVPHLRVGGELVSGGWEAKKLLDKLQVYEAILRDQKSSSQEVKDLIKSRPDLLEEQAKEDKMIEQRIRAEKKEVGRDLLARVQKLTTIGG